MPTPTTELRLELQTAGSNNNTWGDVANVNFRLIEDAISGMTTIATTGGTTTLSTANGGAVYATSEDQARYAIIKVTGVLVSDAVLVIPAVSKIYVLWNATTGDYTVTMKVAGDGISVAQGKRAILMCDGTNVYPAENSAGYYVATDFGAVGDGVVEDTVALQDAIDAVYAAGGGTVLLNNKTYLCETLELPSGVILEGMGSSSTFIKLKDGTNAALIRSLGYAALTGTNSWLVGTESVPHGFGLIGINLDCNKVNQTSGNGIEFYGKRYTLKDVIVRDAYAIGIATECAYKGGQTTWHDMPEGLVEQVYVYKAGSHGFQMRGPHDMLISSLFISQSGGDGFRSEALLNTYQGSCDIGLIHSYGNAGVGIAIDTMVNADVLIGETNAEEGITFGSNSAYAIISVARAFNNDYAATGTHFNIDVAGAVQIDQMHVLDGYQSAGGIYVHSDLANIGYADVQSTIAHNGVGIQVDSSNSRIKSNVQNYTGATGTGFKMTNGSRNQLLSWTDNCTTHVNVVAVGNNNQLTFQGVSGGVETQYTGVTNFFGTNSVQLMFSDGVSPFARSWEPSETIMFPKASNTPVNNGEMVFELTSATELKIKVKSGGTVRSASLTLS